MRYTKHSSFFISHGASTILRNCLCLCVCVVFSTAALDYHPGEAVIREDDPGDGAFKIEMKPFFNRK